MIRHVVILLFLLLGFTSFSQKNTDDQLAQYYYSNQEYEKALTYYEKLYKQADTKIYFIRLYECYINTSDIKSAEKLAKKQWSNHEDEPDYALLLAEFYEAQSEQEKATKIYDELIDDLPPSAGKIVALFNAFKGKGKNDLALQTIEKGRKLLKNNYPLHFQFAELYGTIGNTEAMMKEYIDLLDYHSSYLTSIQNVLSRQIDFAEEDSKEYVVLKNELLQRVQKHPENQVYSELLIWLFIQSKNFNAALVQLQALDKRMDLNGRSIYELGNIAIQNNDYRTGRKAFQYVLAKGNQNPLFYSAQNALLNTRFLEITTLRNYSKEELDVTISEYKSTLERSGWKAPSLPLIMELSHIQAFYAGNISESISNLNKALELPGLTDMQRAEVKMKLADIHVLHGDVWEASLLYMQVDKSFKFEPIGHEARFKNARIFYYDGEFNYAQSQLDVLKQSTSKLISNDAIELSLLITDNFGLDSNFRAMSWFAQGDLLIEQHKFDAAYQLFDSIMVNFPYHSLGDEILIKKAKAEALQGHWDASIAFLDELLKYYGDDILADNALFEKGDIYEKHLNMPDKAMECYKELLLKHKGSLYAIETRKRFRKLRGERVEEDDILRP